MVLSALGCEVLEYELRQLCECDETGTAAKNAVLAAKALGFEKSVLAYLELDELNDLISNGAFPITYLRLGNGESHAVVVTELHDGRVYVLDPSDSDLDFIDEDDFAEMWKYKNGLTIIIEGA